jgi:1-acyl-sn-glycerol-3-phosphate acyltransferase
MRTLSLIVLYLVLVAAVIPFFLLCLLFGLRDPLLAYGRWAMKLSAVILGLRPKVTGLENTLRSRPCVIMANHESFLDGPLLFMVIPLPLRVILKKSVFRIPVVGVGMRYVGFVPVDRKRARGGVRSIEKAAALMREKGYCYLIFPEGTRSRDGRMQPFRRGGFFLALRTGAPIVPVTIRGTFELMPKGSFFVKRGPVEVVFHPPVPVEGCDESALPELVEKVRQAITSVLQPGAG